MLDIYNFSLYGKVTYSNLLLVIITAVQYQTFSEALWIHCFP